MIRMYSSPPSSRWVCTTIAARLRRPFPPSSSAPRLPRCAAGRRRHQDRQKQAWPLRSSRRALPGSCDSSSRPTRRSSCTYRLVRTISYVHTTTIALPSCDGGYEEVALAKTARGKQVASKESKKKQIPACGRQASPPFANTATGFGMTPMLHHLDRKPEGGACRRRGLSRRGGVRRVRRGSGAPGGRECAES